MNVIGALSASKDARGWCEEKVLSDNAAVDGFYFSYPNTAYDSSGYSQSLATKMISHFGFGKSEQPGLFGTKEIDEWLGRSYKVITIDELSGQSKAKKTQ